MSTVPTPAAAATPERVAVFSICPVLVASHVAVELGWLDEELRRVGARARFLRSLPLPDWSAHFTHERDNLFRDGGAIPAIWAKAERGDTTLIGLTAAHDGGQIVVRADSDIHALRDLAGRRIGLPRQRSAGIDWWRSVAERAVGLALRIGGVSAAQVEFTDVDYPPFEPAGVDPSLTRPAQLWSKRVREDIAFAPEVRALDAGEVDAVFSNQGKTLLLERTGRFAVIEDLAARRDWRLQIANSPYALTASAALAREHPDILVAYLRAAIRAGHWINANKAAAAAIIQRVTYYPTPADTAAAIAHTDFVPNLDAQNLAAIGIAKRSLRERGYLSRDFEVARWADARFLAEAAAGL